MSQWISVIERKPNGYQEVLVFPPPSDYILTAEYSPAGDEWIYHDYEMYSGDVTFKTEPTHWMPLPEPPRSYNVEKQDESY